LKFKGRDHRCEAGLVKLSKFVGILKVDYGQHNRRVRLDV
jgi:hypothetical protein